MSDCRQIRPLLYPYLEREVEPAEAIEVANHLSSCTACKILMARKHRLGQMLEEGLHDRIPVGEDFVHSVMANLPEGPPPRDKRRRRFDLAVLFGVAVAMTQVVAARLPLTPPEPGGLSLPALALPATDGVGPNLGTALHLVAAAAGVLGRGTAFESLALPFAGGWLAPVTALCAGTLLLIGSSVVFAFGVRSSQRTRNV